MQKHGWKTYLAAAALALSGIVAITNGQTFEGIQGIIAGFGLIGLRSAIAKVIDNTQS